MGREAPAIHGDDHLPWGPDPIPGIQVIDRRETVYVGIFANGQTDTLPIWTSYDSYAIGATAGPNALLIWTAGGDAYFSYTPVVGDPPGTTGAIGGEFTLQIGLYEITATVYFDEDNDPTAGDFNLVLYKLALGVAGYDASNLFGGQSYGQDHEVAQTVKSAYRGAGDTSEPTFTIVQARWLINVQSETSYVIAAPTTIAGLTFVAATYPSDVEPGASNVTIQRLIT